MSLRLWARIRDHLWGWDDAFVVLAGIASFSGDILVCLSMLNSNTDRYSPADQCTPVPDDGLGLHLWTLDSNHLVAYFRVRPHPFDNAHKFILTLDIACLLNQLCICCKCDTDQTLHPLSVSTPVCRSRTDGDAQCTSSSQTPYMEYDCTLLGVGPDLLPAGTLLMSSYC